MAFPAAILNILVTANTKQATASLARLDGQLRASTASAGARSSTMGSTIAKGAKVGAVAVGVLGYASIKAAADFESSFAEVRKTVETNERGFKRLEKGLRGLAKEIPVSVNELNDLAGQAGALGIKAKDLVKFTKTAAELGITTDLSANAAANALARLSNIMGTSSKDFRRLGSTMVELGNRGASTEAEIAEMSLRIAGAGKQVGLTEAQVLSFGSALASVGIRAEAGGSAISRAFITMAEAVDKGGADLDDFAKVAQMTGGQFAKTFEQDAAGAMVAFMQGLEGIRKEGGSVFATLEGLELNEIRVRDALLRASGAGDLFTDTLKTGSREWERNKALTEEAGKRYATTAAQFQIFKNRVYDLFITIGQFLEPATKAFLSTLNQLMVGKGGIVAAAQAIKDFYEESEILQAAFKAVAAVARMVWPAIVQIVRGAARMIEGAVKLISGVLTLNLGRAWEGVKDIFTGGAGVIIGAVRALTAPIRAAAKAIASGLSGPLSRVWEVIKAIWIEGADFILGIVTTILDGMAAMADAGSQIPGPIGDMWDKMQAGAEDASDAINGVREDLRASGNTVVSIGQDWKTGWKAIADTTDNQGQKIFQNWDHWLGRVEDQSRSSGQKTHSILKDIFGDVAADADDKGGDIYRNWDKWLDRTADTGKTASNRFKNQVSGNFANLASASIGAIAALAGETNKTLSSLKVKDQVYVANKAAGGGAGNVTRAQKGAAIVPGSGSGDKVPISAMVEPGEGLFVLNRNAMGALQGMNDRFPRFAAGGWVDPAGPGTGVVNSAIAKVVGAWSQRYNAAINYGYDPGGGHVSPGHNVTGTATDTRPAGGWGAGPTSLFESGLRAITGKVDQILYGSHGVGTPYPNHGFGNHAHIEWGMHPEVQGAIASALSRFTLDGPAGPLRDAGQSAINRVRNALGKFAGSKMGGIGGGDLQSFAGEGVLSKSQLTSLWSRVNNFGDPNLMAAIAMAESSGNPSVTNSIGARGLWQIIPSTADAFGLSYGRLTEPGYNAFGAGKILRGQGLGAWEAYTNGNYSQYLQRGGQLPYIGKYHKGGIAAREGLAHVEKGEAMVPLQRLAGGGSANRNRLRNSRASVTWGSGLGNSSGVFRPDLTYDDYLTLNNIAQTAAQATAGTGDDLAAWGQRADMVGGRTLWLQQQLARPGLSAQRRTDLLQQLDSATSEQASIQETIRGLQTATEESTDAEQTLADAIKAQAEEMAALKDAIREQNGLVRAAGSSDRFQALAALGDLLSGQMGGRITAIGHTAGAGSVRRS